MSDESRPHWKRVPSSRSLVIDILHYARKTLLQPIARHFDLSELASVRLQSSHRISWPILFMRAYARLGARCPVLRQTYIRWPWPHIYQHHQTACMIAISREHRGTERLFFGRFRTPEERTLEQLQSRLDDLRARPVPDLRELRGQILLSRMPWPVRRLVWWLTLNISGYVRVRHLGSFGLTTVGNLGAISINPPSVQSTMLTFGPVDANGQVRVTIVYDHRLLDGGTIAVLLRDLEQIMQQEMVQELRNLESTVPRP